MAEVAEKQQQLIEYDVSIGRQVPPLIEEHAFDTRLPSERELERAYRRYVLAHAALRAVDDPHSFHAQLSDAEKQELFEARLPKLQALEAIYREAEKRCAACAARRATARASYRAHETAQRHLFAEAWPDDFQYIGSRFPYRPLISNDPKIKGSARRPLHEALSWRYVQYNPSAYTHLLIVDYDAKSGIDVAEVWKLAGVAKPSYIARNPNTLKGHLTWAIKTPVPKLDMAKAKSLEYFRAIQVAYTQALGGDFGFTETLTKNPVHPFGAWEVEWLNPHPYTLRELASFVKLPKNARHAKRDARTKALKLSDHEKVGVGRNCAIFYTVAEWAYKAIREFWGGPYEAWSAAVRNECNLLNGEFPEPLGANELKVIINSISRWTWANTTPDGFAKAQASRGAKGGRKSAVTRLAKAQVHAEEAKALQAAGMNQQAIASKLGIHRNTVANLLKRTTP